MEEEETILSNHKLTLHTSGTAALHKGKDFLYLDLVEVMFDSVLQAGCSNRKVDGIGVGISLGKGVDQSAAETITATDPVNNFD